jgi:hypothetical protein
MCNKVIITSVVELVLASRLESYSQTKVTSLRMVSCNKFFMMASSARAGNYWPLRMYSLPILDTTVKNLPSKKSSSSIPIKNTSR